MTAEQLKELKDNIVHGNVKAQEAHRDNYSDPHKAAVADIAGNLRMLLMLVEDHLAAPCAHNASPLDKNPRYY